MGRIRRMRRGAAGAVAMVVVAVALSGCARPGQRDGDRVAEWIDAQDWVRSASASVNVDPWSSGIALTMEVDPAIPDDALYALAAASDRKAHDAGWSSASLTWELGGGRSFSNLGGGATLKVFFGMRNEARYLVASARGSGDCGSFFCVTIADSDPETLSREVEHLLELAEQAGGVQANLDFEAASRDGRFVVSAQPDASSKASVELLGQIMATVPVERAWAWVVEPVGDIPAAPMLDLRVPDQAAKAAVEQIAATQSVVEVDVDVADPATAP